jgi:hypothetical protein
MSIDKCSYNWNVTMSRKMRFCRRYFSHFNCLDPGKWILRLNVNPTKARACVSRLVSGKESEKPVRVEKVAQTTTAASRPLRGESKVWPWCFLHGRYPHDFSPKWQTACLIFTGSQLGFNCEVTISRSQALCRINFRSMISWIIYRSLRWILITFMTVYGYGIIE